jgi:hypothetical protein
LVGAHPDAHGILPGAENGNLRDTVDERLPSCDVGKRAAAIAGNDGGSRLW